MTKLQLRRFLLAFGMMAALAFSASARADDPTSLTTLTAKRADGEGFVPVKPGEVLQPGEVIPASRLVGIAYGVILAALTAFVGSLAMRSRTVEEEVASLRIRINKQFDKSDKQA